MCAPPSGPGPENIGLAFCSPQRARARLSPSSVCGTMRTRTGPLGHYDLDAGEGRPHGDGAGLVANQAARRPGEAHSREPQGAIQSVEGLS